MSRPRRALLAAGSLALLLTACAGGDATQGSVSEDVKEDLLAREGNELSAEEADVVADCVSRGIFESGEFSKEERNDATRAADGDDPSVALVEKVQTLVDGCLDEAEAAS